MMITIIPMAQHNSTDSWGTWLELDPTPPSGLWSPTGPYRQVHSVLVCLISLLEQNLPQNVCCYNYYYYYYYYDVEIEPVLQEITGEELNRGANRAPDARLDIHARGFWDRQQSAFFDVRVCHPNADSYRELSPKQIFQLHENEKKRQYSRRVLEVEQGTFTPLVFTSTGGMADECKRFHSRLAELLVLKKGDDYSTTISWIRAKVSFAILRSALLCLRGTRRKRRAANISDIDITSESAQARI